MFSLLTRTLVRIATPIVAPFVRPAIAHAVVYFQPIEANFDDIDHSNDRVVAAVSKVIHNVAIAEKQARAVVEAPSVVTSLAFDRSIVLMTSIVKAPVIVASRVVGLSTEAMAILKSLRADPIGNASVIVRDVKKALNRFVPSFLLRYVPAVTIG